MPTPLRAGGARQAFGFERVDKPGGIARLVIETSAQHAVVKHHRLPRRALHRHTALVQRLRCAAQFQRPGGVVTALQRDVFEREQSAQRCGAEQGGDQQKSDDQQLPERKSLQHR